MREIKFRSWNHRDKVMETPDNIANCIDGDKYQIMQYTGLKDKNSKEIYENDLLHNPMDAFNRIYYVQWIDGGFWFEPLPENGMRQFGQHFNHRIAGSCKVIGNIYENPELLEGK